MCSKIILQLKEEYLFSSILAMNNHQEMITRVRIVIFG